MTLGGEGKIPDSAGGLVGFGEGAVEFMGEFGKVS